MTGVLVIIPLPLQGLFRGILLIVQLVQSPLHVLFSLLPSLFGRTLGMIHLIIVVVFFTLESILSSLPLSIKTVVSSVLRSFIILF